MSEPAPLDRSSPAKVLEALGAAIERQDAAAIARLRARSAGKPTLDTQDLLRAKLDFLGERARHWRRVLAAADSTGLASLETAGERATLRVDLGGDAGVVRLVFVKEGGAWAVAL